MNKLWSKPILFFIAGICLLTLSACNSSTDVKSSDELIAATKNAKIQKIKVSTNLTNVPTIKLAPGQKLIGTGNQTTIKFTNNVDGLQLTTDNKVTDLSLQTTPNRRAIFNDTRVEKLGEITLKDLSTIGQVQILVRDNIRSGKVTVNGLDIIAADTRNQPARLKGYGVYVAQGAFTLWNMQTANNVVITADLKDISAGRANAPVYGSGIFVSGGGFKDNGKLDVPILKTEGIYSDGKIQPKIPGQIAAAVFVAYGVDAEKIVNQDRIITYGVNDIILENWGTVDKWTAEEKLISHGDGATGFANFGIIKDLIIDTTIETYGEGARGFNAYDGTIDVAKFKHIVTHDDGAVGIQVASHVNHVIVNKGIETFGGASQSLVKGVVTRLAAAGLGVKHGGLINEVDIDGGIITHGKQISPIELYGGNIEKINIEGDVKALGDK